MMMNNMEDEVIDEYIQTDKWGDIMTLTKNIGIISLVINLTLKTFYISFKRHKTHGWHVQYCPFHDRIRSLKLFKSMAHLILVSSEFHNFTL